MILCRIFAELTGFCEESLGTAIAGRISEICKNRRAGFGVGLQKVPLSATPGAGWVLLLSSRRETIVPKTTQLTQ